MKKIIISVFVFIFSFSAVSFGQSKSFQFGQWLEIQNAILKELNRSYVDSLPVGRIMRVGVDAMLENLDPYTVYIPEEENEDLQMMLSKTYGGIGAIIYKKTGAGVIINEPYYGSPAYKNGLVCGDEILEINGEPTLPLSSKESSDKMKGRPGTSVNFRVKKVRTGEIVDLSITRERIHLPDIQYAGMLNDTTGYILQTGFTDNVSSEMKAAILKLKGQGMKKLVYDLRGNGGGLMSEAINIVSLFVPKGSLVVTAKGLKPENRQEYRTTAEPVDTELPLVVMIDGASASSSEIVAGALQDMDRATIMGKRSFGKGLVQSMRALPYNGTLKLTTAKYYTPSGRCVQAIDYGHRKDDGSVAQIPDSLTTEFKTAHGRTVRDGGGITPDVDIPAKSYSRLIYSLVLNGIIDEYVLDYVKTHAGIAPLDDFHFTDSELDDFIAFAKTRDFDFRSGAQTYFDQMKAELEQEGMAESMRGELDAISKALEMDKEKVIRLKKDEIIPFIEEELAVRYYYQEAGIKVRLRYDTQLHAALEKPLIEIK